MSFKLIDSGKRAKCSMVFGTRTDSASMGRAMASVSSGSASENVSERGETRLKTREGLTMLLLQPTTDRERNITYFRGLLGRDV